MLQCPALMNSQFQLASPIQATLQVQFLLLRRRPLHSMDRLQSWLSLFQAQRLTIEE
jgi:hypothetical protein